MNIDQPPMERTPSRWSMVATGAMGLACIVAAVWTSGPAIRPSTEEFWPSVASKVVFLFFATGALCAGYWLHLLIQDLKDAYREREHLTPLLRSIARQEAKQRGEAVSV